MSFISKNQLIPTNVNLAMVFICKLFQSSSQVGRLKSCSVTTGVKRNFWPLRNFWPVIVFQLFCFSE